MNKRQYKNITYTPRGVTLVALVITVVIMIILAMIALRMAYVGGIFEQTEKAAELYDNEQIAEGNKRNEYQNELDEVTGKGPPPPPSIPVIVPNGTGGTNPTMTATCGVIEIAWVDKDNNVMRDPLPPELMGMDKVAWDGTREMLPSEITTSNWYNYIAQTGAVDGITSKWANAKNSDGSYFVWIPRYAYKIIYFDTDANRLAYLNNNTSTTGIIAYYTKDGKINATTNKIIIGIEPGIQSPITAGYTDYIVHPAFETNVDLGGWDSDLSGLWVGKYEMSGEINGVPSPPKIGAYNSPGDTETSDILKAVSKPRSK